MMIRSFGIALLLVSFAGCGSSQVCTTGTCTTVSLAFSATPLVVQAIEAQASAPGTVSLLSAQSSLGFSIQCDQGVIVTPSSGTISGGTLTLSVQAPNESAAGVVNATCTATSAQDATAGATLPVVVVTSAEVPPLVIDGGVTARGGTVDHLYFAVIGDSRPGDIDQVSEYPTQVIGQIFQDVQAIVPRPQFGISTGDYMYASTTTYTAQPQASLYMKARGAFSNTVFPVMGNHECDGYTADNCVLGQTQNNQAFISTILAPIQQPLPYYAISINGTGNAWTSKLIFIACNEWDDTQQSWLVAQLRQATTYTILARHEPAADNTAPCVSSVEAIIQNYPYDLSLVGHTHEFSGNPGSKEIIIGNGGAPLSRGTFGFTTIERLSGGWQVENYDYSTGLPVNTFTIAP